jgi:hypothetical protein
LRCKGVIGGGWQVPAQTFSAPEGGAAERSAQCNNEARLIWVPCL